jgi:hypothetical protein
MPLNNPYLTFFRSLGEAFWRNPLLPVDNREMWSPDWLRLKAAVAGHFSWAVPTDEAIAAIRRHTSRAIEIGCGSGYWAWLMEQAGIQVLAFDVAAPAFSWHEVLPGNEAEVLRHPDRTLFLCWPPWATDMAFKALSYYRGDHVIYVGEWMVGNADPQFFALLAAGFEEVESVAIPQWLMRSDRLTIYRRRSPGGSA